MADEFKIRWFNTSGVLQAETVDWLAVAYNKKVNDPGIAYVSIPGNHSILDSLTDKFQVEIWRQNVNQGVDWYRDFEGIVRRITKSGIEPGIVEILVPGSMHMLTWRRILWYAGAVDRSVFVSEKAETIMKTLVDFNISDEATVDWGRLREGDMTTISVETDTAAGNTISLYCAWKGLLTTLQRVAQIAGGDFDLVKTGDNAWEFRWFTGQLGTDRTATVEFSIGKANMSNPIFDEDFRSEKTVALVAGGGEGELRESVIRTGDNYNVTTNNIEVFADARNVAPGDSVGLNAEGDSTLDELKVYSEFSFDVLQTPSSYYGKHYFLGDLVKVVSPFSGTSETKKINEISVSAQDDGNVQIQVVTADG